jgi:hypothetical protein
MARMYPATIADDHGSHAERWIFRKLRDETTDDWAVVHSVGLLSHATKPWAEVDFVAVGPEGVYCLEVKGGHIEHRDGDWYTNGNRLKQSPFAQAGGGASALFDYLAQRVPAVRRSIVGHGVMFPETRFDQELPEAEAALVYDDRDLTNPMSDYLARLATRWINWFGERFARPAQEIPSAVRSRILHEIAPDFDLVPTLRSRLVEVDEELVRLTERQKELLDGLVDEPRVLVKGGAGTGKTLLAAHEAARLARQGRRTLYICFGARLATHMAAALADEEVEAIHLHRLMARLINEADLRDQLPDVQERDLFDIYYPQLALDALDRLGRLGSIDALVVDEGQDILKPPYVQFLDALLADELENGCWRLFYDPNQDIFAGRAPSELDRVENLATCYRLTKNCRNTREIALTTSILSGIKVAETLTAEGPDVAEAWGSDRAALERGFRRLLHEWIERGVDPEQIVVLSPRTLERSLVSTFDQSRLPRRILDIDDPGRGIRFSTIAGFKGLESDAVLLVDIDELSSAERVAQLYTGASRAKSLLGIVLEESCRDVYTERVRDLVDRTLHAASDPS